MLKHVVCLLSLTAVAAGSALAAPNMAPGLWEVTTESALAKNMPTLPAAQIEQMRKLGVDLGKLQSGTIVNKICITPEMAARNEIPKMSQKESGCEIKNQQQHGHTYTMEMVCNGQMKGKGVSTTTFSGNKSFSTRTQFSGNMNGLPINDDANSSGKWLSADCGTVKPIALPR
jgi:hypothetical protein